jgi:glycosyltransferase involved in cell wall biosynthesis
MILFIATAWNAAAGGINAFNIELARATARIAHKVACGVTDFSEEAFQDASAEGVILFQIPADANGKPLVDCTGPIMEFIRAESLTGIDLYVGHDLLSGPAAANASQQLGGQLALVHHMDYISYQNFNGDRADDAVANHKRQISLFSNPDAHVFGVGKFLADSAAVLGECTADMLVPGLPAMAVGASRQRLADFRVLSAGRFEKQTEPLKRIGTAVRGFAKAVREGRTLLPHLASPTMTIIGVEPGDLGGDLKKQATMIAGVPVNIVPAGYDPDPQAVATLSARSHLVVVPSRHEGFGLVGWEAIGTGTPLIIGRGTGLALLLSDILKGDEEGLVHILPLDGSDDDEHLIATAILKVARNPADALDKAKRLRARIAAELCCTWEAAAEQLLDVLVKDGKKERHGVRNPDASAVAPEFTERCNDDFPRCVELGVSAAQGSTRQSLELIVELRFGITEFAHDGIRADIGVNRTTLEVKPRMARIARADRLGEGSRCLTGVEARAGGAWIISSPAGALLLGRSLGTESLCVVEHSSNQPLAVDVEVTAARNDVICTVTSAKGRLSTAQKKVMAIFLKDAMWKTQSEHFILSSASLQEREDDK